MRQNSLAESGHLHPRPKQCPYKQRSLKLSLTRLELLTMGCCLELSLGKGDTLSGPQPLSPGKGSPSKGSTAAQARGRRLPPTAQELQILFRPEPPEALRPAWDTDSPRQQNRDPFSAARRSGLLRQGISVRKAGWGVQAGRAASSGAKECLGIPGPVLCHKLASAQS